MIVKKEKQEYKPVTIIFQDPIEWEAFLDIIKNVAFPGSYTHANSRMEVAQKILSNIRRQLWEPGNGFLEGEENE